jgi:hypothetical protein
MATGSARSIGVIPWSIDRLTRRALLLELAALSDEAMTFHTRTSDVGVLVFLARVVLVVEQTRVHLGGRAA